MGRRILGAVQGAVLGLLATGIPAFGARADEPARLIQRPDWAQIPTGDDLAKYYPERAMREGVSGKAILTCAVTAEGLLTACSAVEDKPGGYDFDKAALALSASFRMKSATRDGKPVAGGQITIPIVFQVPEGPAMGPHGMKFGDGTIIITKLDPSKPLLDPRAIVFNCPDGQGRCQIHPIIWTERPDPIAAAGILQRSGQVVGLTVASCGIADGGRLQDCEVHGDVTTAAAEAAVKDATALMRSADKTVDGLPTAGAHVQIAFKWDSLLLGLKPNP